MKNTIYLALFAGLVSGSALTYAAGSVARGRSSTDASTQVATHDMSAMGTTSSPSLTMSQMTASLRGKSGDDFDREFISEMTAHHMGAIEMAKEAAASAKHQEVKNMAAAIVSAQQSEIAEMEGWRKAWGY